MNDSDGIIAKVDQARLLLAACCDAGQAKKVADLARAAEVYARRQKLSEEAIAHATAIRVDAMTLMGEFLKAVPKAKPVGSNQHKKQDRFPGDTDPPTLAAVGITKKESSDAQALAALRQQAPGLHTRVRSGVLTVAKARAEVRRQQKREDFLAGAVTANGQRDEPSWRLIQGECPELIDRRKIGTPRLVFADPPYNVGVDYGGGTKADRLPDHHYLDWTQEWVAACHRVLTDDGSLWVLIGDEYADHFGIIFRRIGFHRRAWIKWYETFGVNCADNFNRTSRHLFYLVKDPKNFTFHPDAVSRPSDRQVVYKDHRASHHGKLWDDVWWISRLTGTCAERVPDFPTQLPLALLRPVVGCASDPGDLVLDPFSGSGTTGVAAVEAGRRYVGIEKSPEYVRLAALRLKGVNCACESG